MKQSFTREQRTTIIYGVLCLVLSVTVLQLWLLTATMNAHLGGDETVIWPSVIASALALTFNLGLLRYLALMERRASNSWFHQFDSGNWRDLRGL